MHIITTIMWFLLVNAWQLRLLQDHKKILLAEKATALHHYTFFNWLFVAKIPESHMKKLTGSAKLEYSARLQASPQRLRSPIIFGKWYKLVGSKSFMLLDFLDWPVGFRKCSVMERVRTARNESLVSFVSWINLARLQRWWQNTSLITWWWDLSKIGKMTKKAVVVVLISTAECRRGFNRWWRCDKQNEYNCHWNPTPWGALHYDLKQARNWEEWYKLMGDLRTLGIYHKQRNKSMRYISRKQTREYINARN